ncbi:hypothetical protein JZM37_15820 [Acinetobacter pittii]|uniref:hypothetical protein n=1 Tax=Acinetobacter pittii TaxID=48296 RepID=UPI00197F91CE|nr:hypothetical protein [Acinetobacter pittii]MBN6525710.1 hypothetical protein [Acinetobacter pittii]
MKTEKKLNKHGLPRDIPSDIQKKIRKNDGYGCVLCGQILVDYEHIDPLYCDAKEHDASKIALLCSHHHDLVTRRVLPKRMVKEAKANPFCKREGYAHSHYYPSLEEVKFKLGDVLIEDTMIILKAFGQPLIWIEKESSDSPLLFNAIFRDSVGNKIGFLNKNTFYGNITDADIKGVSNRIEIKLKRGSNDLCLKIEADGIVEIQRLNYNFLNFNVIVDNKGKVHIKKNGVTIVSFGGIICGANGSGIGIGDILSRDSPIKRICLEMLKIHAPRIINIKGQILGYYVLNCIYSNCNRVVADVLGNKVLSPWGEKIGEITPCNEIENSFYISALSENERGKEPVFITPYNRDFNKISKTYIEDVSYLLFGI